MAKSQFAIRIKMFVIVLAVVLGLVVTGATAVYFYIGHGVTAKGSTADFTAKLVFGSSFTVDDVIKDQGYKYGWLKSKVDTEVYSLNDKNTYVKTEGLAEYDEKTRTFEVAGVGKGKIVFTNPVDSSVSFTLPFETKFSVADTEEIIKAQYPTFYADGVVTGDELEQIIGLNFSAAKAYDISDFGYCKNFERVVISADSVVALKGQNALDGSVNFYVEPSRYSEYMTSAAWRNFTERVFPAESLDKSMANLVFTLNGGQKDGFDFTLMFDAVEKGKPLDMKNYEITRTGYTFTGWYESNDGGKTLGKQVTASTEIVTDIKLYAGWSENSYNIVYVDDVYNTPAELLPAVDRVMYTEKTKISEKKPVQTGRTFLYWLHDNEKFMPGQEVQSLTGENDVNFVLKAAWQTNEYTIIYDGNGVTEGVPDKLTNVGFDKNVNLSDAFLVRNGYKFLGWSSDNKAVQPEYLPAASVSRLTPSGTIILYAVWQANTYKITFDEAGGSYCDQMTVAYDKPYYLPTPTRSGYYFRGWYTSGGSNYDNSGIWKSTDNLALTARWAKRSATYNNESLIRVTDDGVGKNGCDTINLKALFGYSMSEYRAMGANYITFNITVYISEINDGYQEIYLSNQARSSKAVWSKTNIEHGAGRKDTKTYAHTFSPIVSIASCNDIMYMNYGAHGSLSDDWNRHSISIVMTLS